MSDLQTQIADNVSRVRERIAVAAEASGRSLEAITLVAVTKYVGADEIRALLAAGCRDLGESRPQQLWDKATQFESEPVRWHIIGHLQRNKVRRTLPLVSMVHSGDSRRILQTLNTIAGEMGRRVPTLLEVNISGDVAKHGLTPDEVKRLLPELPNYENLQVRGLMAMAARDGGRDVARANFAAVRELRDRLMPDCPAGVSLDDLSMGMSHDFDVAIREGATIVRVGSALFSGVLE